MLMSYAWLARGSQPTRIYLVGLAGGTMLEAKTDEGNGLRDACASVGLLRVLAEIAQTGPLLLRRYRGVQGVSWPSHVLDDAADRRS